MRCSLPARLLGLLLALACAVLPCRPASADAFGDLKARYEKEKDKDFSTRMATLNEVAALGTAEGLRWLERVSKDDHDPSVRVNALWSIAKVKLPEAGQSLLETFRKGEPKDRGSILSAWTSYRTEDLPEDVIATALASKDVSARSSLLTVFARRNDPRLLAECGRYLSDFPTNASSIINPLSQRMSPGAVPLLLAVFDETKAYERDNVPRAFSAVAPDVKQALVDAITKGVEPALTRAAQVAARARIAEAEAALLAAAHAAKDDERKAFFLDAATRVGLASEEGLQLALQCLRSPKEVLVLGGARALRVRPCPTAIPLLIRLLGSRSTPIKAEARVTLERITGQGFGDRADLWEAWWKEHGATFDPSKVPAQAEADALDRTLVDLALEKGAEALRAMAAGREAKSSKAPWEYGSHPVGTTALVLLALHAVDADTKEKAFTEGLRWLLSQPVPDSTYDAGIVAMALETIGGKKHAAKVKEATRVLLAAQNEQGGWGYSSASQKTDHSNGQYAILGLRHAVRAGVKVPEAAWRNAHAAWMRTQNPDGGWTYVPTGPKDTSTCSMTAAGVSSLLICAENLALDEAGREATWAAIDRGFVALGKLMKVGTDSLYALYGVERAGVLGRRALLGTVPWYAPGAKRILDEQARDGLWTGPYHRAVDSALALLFLKKATAPIAGPITGDGRPLAPPPAPAPAPSPAPAPAPAPTPAPAPPPAPAPEPLPGPQAR